MIAFVVGTGTGIGKTTFASAWLRHLRARGIDAVGWKPIETGGDDDQRALAQASGRWVPAHHAYPTPVAAHRSARLAGTRIDFDELVATIHGRASMAELLLVETAGGLFSPIDDDGRTNAELAVAAGDHAVLVTADRLGVLHDVEACVRAARASGLRLDAIIANRMLALLDQSVATNVEDLRAHARMPIVAFDGELDDTSRTTLDALVAEWSSRPPTSQAP